MSCSGTREVQNISLIQRLETVITAPSQYFGLLIKPSLVRRHKTLFIQLVSASSTAMGVLLVLLPRLRLKSASDISCPVGAKSELAQAQIKFSLRKLAFCNRPILLWSWLLASIHKPPKIEQGFIEKLFLFRTFNFSKSLLYLVI